MSGPLNGRTERVHCSAAQKTAAKKYHGLLASLFTCAGERKRKRVKENVWRCKCSDFIFKMLFPLISIYKPPAITCWTQND